MALTQVSTGGIKDGQVQTADLADSQITAAKLHADALDHTYTLGASGTDHYTFTGEGLTGAVNDPTLYLTRGKTYRFVNGNSSGAHPFRIQSVAGAGGTEYNTGVTNNAGGGGSTIIFEVPHNAPDVLYYICTSHATMNGIFYVTGALADGTVTTAKLASSVSSAITANTNKTTNATHTGDVTGSTSLTIAADAVTTAKIADDAVTADKLANSINTAIAANTAKDLTALSASNLTSGTIPDARLPATLPAISGANLTNLPAGGQAHNLIINGGMKVAQRGTVTNLLYNYSGPDRFRLTGDGNQRSTVSSDSITVDSKGQSNAYKLDVTTASGSLSANHYQMISYRFEGQDLQHLEKGTSNAKPITLQFWVKSPKTGVHIVELIDQSNSSRHINKSYTISSANTWQKVVITFPGDTTGAITNDNARRFDLNFWLMAGSTWSSGTLQTSWGSDTNANRAVGQVNVVDSTSNEFYLTGVQLEVGSVATDFEHKSYGQELALCQRYYQTGFIKIYDSNAGVQVISQNFMPEMRAAPTVTGEQFSGQTNAPWGSIEVTTSRACSFYKNGVEICQRWKCDAEI